MLSNYCASLTQYKRLKTRTVNVGSIKIGGDAPIVVQTMTTTDTMDTAATVEQTIRCIEAGAELVRITAPSKKEGILWDTGLRVWRLASKAHPL
jgi:(E)-4-hydroxy-3-methylbut-2-enyl-diphosphate synthase